MKKLAPISFLLLAACSHTPPAPIVEEPSHDDEVIGSIIAEHAKRAADATHNLALLAQAESPPQQPGLLALDVPPQLMRRLTLTWNGPIAPLVHRLAKEAGYSFQVRGTPPAAMVTVRIYKHMRTIKELLDEVGLQAGARATVYVDIGRGLIELRYDYVG